MKIDDLSIQQERNPTAVSLLLAQNQDVQSQANSLTIARASRSGASHVPCQPLTLPSSRGMPCRDFGLPLTTQNTLGTSGNVFQRVPTREGPSSFFLRKFEEFRIIFLRIET